MKKKSFQLLVFVFCVFFSLVGNHISASCVSPRACRGVQASGEPNEEFYMPCEKKYVALNDIVMSEKGIFIKLEGHTIKTSTLFSDEKGFYFQDLFHLKDCFAGLDYTCKQCGVCNAAWQNSCRHCDQKLTKDNIIAKK